MPAPSTSVRRLLLVDDAGPVRDTLVGILRTRGFEVATATPGFGVLELLAREPVHVLISDLTVPGFIGPDFVLQALATDPDLAIVMLARVDDPPAAALAMRCGAMDYLVTPAELPRLPSAIEGALNRREWTLEQRRLEAALRDDVARRTAELDTARAALDDLAVGVAHALVNALEAKNVFLRDRSQRVAALAASVASAMGLPAETVEQVRLAGRLQDIGKIGIREAVLDKPGKLTPDEYEHVKDHVRIGMEILAPLGHLGDTLRYVQDHHEHWNGRGYPRGLAGEEISLGGRILCAVDTFDAVTSRRPHRDARSTQETLDYLDTLSGRMLDPQVCQAVRMVVTGTD